MRSHNRIVWMIVAGLAALFATAACDDEGGDSRLDDGTPPDADSDGDADGDADECTDVTWGSGLAVGEPVANWTQAGYLDANGDGVVEEEEVEFSLQDINCDGVDSIVLMIGSTT